MKIFVEVAVVEGTSTTERGKLLERLAERLLKTQNFEVTTEVRLTGLEVDLLAKDKATGEVVYVECKAHRSTIAAEILDKLLGQVWRRNCSAGWLVSTYELGKDAKGIVEEFSLRTPEERRKLQVYDPVRLVDRLVNAQLIVDPETLRLLKNAEVTNESYLLITSFGQYWACPLADKSTGVRTAVAIYDAENGNPITDAKTIELLRGTDTTLSDLEWIAGDIERSSEVSDKVKEEIQSIVPVPRAEKWADYRPARPQDFIGRDELLSNVFKFLDRVRLGSTPTRIFALKAPSGWGKSSAVVKIVDKSRNKLSKNRFFVYAVDSRAASSRRFGEFALLRALREATSVGFVPGIDGLTIGGSDSPLSGNGMSELTAYLKSKHKVICIIFDQFEELLYKHELTSVFEDMRLLCDAISAAQENIVVGFSWKTDGTITTEHKAYHLWHALSDHRTEYDLKPFNQKEISSALGRFAKELGEPLVPNLRRMLKEHCRGYPWLLKKLAIHIYDLVKSGMDQAAVMDKSLNISDLFNREMQTLTETETACIRKIAEDSPAEFFRAVELFGAKTVDQLIAKRIVIRSGQRLTLYWDIFRDYVLSGKVPTIPVNYIPKANIGLYVEGVRFLLAKKSCTFADIGKALRLGGGAVDNLVRDYVAVGHAESIRSSGLVTSTCSNDTDAALVLHKFCRSHSLYVAIEREYGDSGSVTEAQIVEILADMYRDEGFSKLTHKNYSIRMITWLESVALLERTDKAYAFTKKTAQALLPTNSAPRHISYFSAHVPPESVVNALEVLRSGPVDALGFEKLHSRSAALLRALRLIGYTGKQVIANVLPRQSSARAVAEAAAQAQTVRIAGEIVRHNPKAVGEEVGKKIAETLEIQWTASTYKRLGNAARRWHYWCQKQLSNDDRT